MSDRYLEFANSTLGRRLVGAVGLPRPTRLERWVSGRSRPVDGAILLGGGALAGTLAGSLKRLSNELYADRDGLGELTRWPGAGKLKALVFDASALNSPEQLIELQRFFQPALPHLASCPHILVIGRAPESLTDPFAASAQRSLEGFTRSLAKAHTTADRLEAGVIGINTFVASTADTPFGGAKDSGYGREGGPYAIRDYLDTKFINVAMPADAE